MNRLNKMLNVMHSYSLHSKEYLLKFYNRNHGYLFAFKEILLLNPIIRNSFVISIVNYNSSSETE